MFIIGRDTDKNVTISHFNDVLKEELRDRRKAVLRGEGISQPITFSSIYEEIAEYSGVSVNTVMKLRRQGEPSLRTSVSIAEYFGRNVEDIWQVVPNVNYKDERPRCKRESCDRLAIASDLCAHHFSANQNELLREERNGA